MNKFVLFSDVASLNKAIKDVKTKGATLQTLMHKVAVSCLAHIRDHGDVRPLASFLHVVPDAVRANALRKWAETFGQVTIEDADDGSMRVHFNRAKGCDIEGAIKAPFWTFRAKEGTPYKAIDPAAELRKVIKTFERDQEKAGVDHSHVIKALKVQLAALASAKMLVPAPKMLPAPLLQITHVH